jgi:phosphatidylglycerophosphate synthase
MKKRILAVLGAVWLRAVDLLEAGYALTEQIARPCAKFIFRPLIKKDRTDFNAFWTVPTLISISRAVAGTVILVARHKLAVVIPLFVWGVISDHLDGSLARLMGHTAWGIKADAWCDRIFFIFCVAAYWDSFDPFYLKTMVGLELLVLSSPLLAIYAAKMKLKPEDFNPNIFGKWRFAVGCLAVAAAIVGATGLANTLLKAAIVLVILASLYRVIESAMIRLAD